MNINRRELLLSIPAAAWVADSAAIARSQTPPVSPPAVWARNVRRLGQLNMTEHDPVALNVEEWADYWASLKVNAVLVSVTGILAFYQTNVPFHRRGRFLGSRDFFGDCCAAAKKRGIRVIARMSPDLNWEDAVQAHPEWFQRNKDGEVIRHGEEPRLFRTCMFSTYMTDYVPAIMKEINGLYDVDGLFTNAWPPLGSMPNCSCEQCRKLPPSGTPAYWDKFNERTMQLWKLYDSIAKESIHPTSSLPISAAASVRPPTWWSWGRFVNGSSAITRGAAATTRRSGDARCRGESAARCSRARWPRTLRERGPPVPSAGETSTNHQRKRACG